MQTFRGTTCLGGKDSGVLSPSAHLQRCDFEQCLAPLWAFSCLWMKPEAPACFSPSSHVLLVLLTAIVTRCFTDSRKSDNLMGYLMCIGVGAMMMFQILINVGMCLGIMPVIGLTLPLISYGGSSIIATYTMLGLVSGVHARPAPPTHERYIRAPY